MTEWARKRFWSRAEAAPGEGGHAILLDGRPVRTPSGRPLEVPTVRLADAIASEWEAQGEVIAPQVMHHTRAANTAIDRVAPRRDAVVDMIAAYGDTDLLCYRAEAPEALAERQRRAWDPYLDWAAEAHGARLLVAAGVMHVAQPPASLGRLRAAVEAADAFALTALHELVTLSGSLVLGLAAMDRHAAPETLWEASRVDEAWQAEQWGEDAEASAAAADKRAAFLRATEFLEFSRPDG